MDAAPNHWRRAFAYTPEKPHAHAHPDTPVDNHQPNPDANEHPLPRNDDSLPQVGRVSSHSHSPPPTWSRSRLRARRVSTSTSLSAPFAPSALSSNVPVKRRQRNRVGGVDNRSSSMSPVDQTKTPGTTSRKRKRTMSVQVQTIGDVIGEGSVRVDTPDRLGAPPRKRARLVFDAVVIVRKNTGRRSSAKPETVHVLSPHPEDSSPRGSTEPEIAASLGTGAETPIASDMDSDPPLVRKTSKYFTRAPGFGAHPERREPDALTPPSSPVLTIPVSIESSEFEPTFGEDDHELHTDEIVDGGLYDDLMIMLRRLKPILIQESIADEPWKVLIAVRLLNVTTARAAIPVYSKIIHRWPTPRDLANAPHEELIELLRPLGLYNKRAEWLKDMSSRFAKDYHSPTWPSVDIETCVPMPRTTRSLGTFAFVPASPIFYYPGVGKYARDSLRIFCSSSRAGLVGEEEWKRVMPEDKELVRYLRWRWAVEEGKIWYPGGVGVVGDIDVPYLVTLVDELAEWFDHTLDATGEVYMYHFYNDLCDALERS